MESYKVIVPANIPQYDPNTYMLNVCRVWTFNKFINPAQVKTIF